MRKTKKNRGKIEKNESIKQRLIEFTQLDVSDFDYEPFNNLRKQFPDLVQQFPQTFQLFIELKQLSLVLNECPKISQNAIKEIKDRIDGKAILKNKK